MSISAKVIADSINPEGFRLTTFQLRYPRFIHAEFMTHRAFSRNASSSRAIPVSRLIADIKSDPAMPVFWGANQAGMQAREELDEGAKRQVIMCWNSAREAAIHLAQTIHNIGAHKQIVNRVLEPFAHINVIATATDYANFYALRRHPDAQPEIKALADAMWEVQQQSGPRPLKPGAWHLPYVTDFDEDFIHEASGGDLEMVISNLIKLSVARCARVSYFTHEGKRPAIDEDLRLYGRLVGGDPLHASPAEHQATPDTLDDVGDYKNPRLHGNLTGFVQYRKTLPGEFVRG